MKYIKKFEMNENEPSVGDYVICHTYNTSESDFVNNRIGKLIKIDYENGVFPYYITYDNIPEILVNDKIGHDYMITFPSISIKYWSKDKNELELILNSDKFNI